MPYKYLRDPMFLAVTGIYLLNRWTLKPLTSGGFLHNSLNDLICIPFLVPLLCWVGRRLQLRDHDEPPNLVETLIPLVVWAILFELVFPQSSFWSRYVKGDAEDILWYAIGACAASIYWAWLAQSKHTATDPAS